MISIKKITSVQTYIVRHPVLRAGKPRESCYFAGDDDPTTEHFGLFLGEELVAVTSIFGSRSEKFPVENQLQLRGMAVLESHQKKGFGEQLLSHAEYRAVERAATILWFNARSGAVAFYERNGYERVGDEFEIAGVGPHFLMYKSL